MLASFDAVNEEIDEKASCSGVELSKSNCEVDVEMLDSTEQCMKACQDMGGKTIEVNTAIEKRDQLTVNDFNFKYTGLMDCVPMECDDESVNEKIGGAIGTMDATFNVLGYMLSHDGGLSLLCY